MTLLPAAYTVFALATAQAQTPNELRTLAAEGSDSALGEAVRRSPIAARYAWRELLGVAGRKDDSVALVVAERLAVSVAIAWRDSFLLRQTARFRSLSPGDRQATAAADSVWEAGRQALGSRGLEVAIGIMRESLRRFEVVADTVGMADALNALGSMLRMAQEYDSAEAVLTRSYDLAERVGDYRGQGKTLGNLGIVSRVQGDLPRAGERYARARVLFERIGDKEGLTLTENSLGNLAWSLGDLAGARRAFEAALAGHRSSGNADGAAGVLHNLGAVAVELAGDHVEGARRVREALAIYRERGDDRGAAEELFTLGQFANRRGDYPAAVATLTEAAGMLSRMPPIPGIDETMVRLELAQVQKSMGDIQGARRELARAEVLANRQRRPGGGGDPELAAVALAKGDLALQFNRLAEGEREYQRAERLARGGSDRAVNVRNRARHGRAGVLFQREDYRGVQAVLQEVLRDEVDVHNRAQARWMLGRAAWESGDTVAARRAFAQVLDTLRALGAAVDEAASLAGLGDLEAEAGRGLAAESVYHRGLSRLGARSAPGAAWSLHAGLGGVLRRRGALDDAARELRLSIADIEQVSGALPLEEQRSAFRADKWDPYVELALVELGRRRMEAAFEASERLRARQMLDLLARGTVAPGAAGALTGREQDLRRRITELADQAGRAGEGTPTLRDPAPAEREGSQAGEALARAQEEYGELLAEIREADPAYAALVRGETAPARDVRAALAPDEALIEYLVGDSTTIVFVVTGDSVAALDLKVTHAALAASVDFARSTLASPTEATRRAWRAPLRRLYRQLIEPVEASGLLTGKARLIIAPHAELHYLPFAALARPGPPDQLLVERYVLEYVPSASVWLRLRARTHAVRGGDVLALAPRTAALPGSRAEMAAIRRTHGDRARALVGPQATEAAFRAQASGSEVIHLATFGVLNKHNPLFSYVQLNPGGGDDGRLEVHEVFGLSLQARLVVLSACQTGVASGALADVPPGDDWIGLVQGFLYAGAGNVLATLWPVSDLPTARLMDRFYGELGASRPDAEALTMAQRAALRDPATAHPFYWAGFTLVRGR
jgi:CHAT domain-containing protein